MDVSLQPTPLTDAEPLCVMGTAELTRRFVTGDLSPVEVAHAVLARAEAVDSKLNAFTLIDHDHALASAKASEQRWRAGAALSPIDGVPTTVKDIVWVRGWPTGYGSLTSDTIAGSDAPAVERLREAGAVIIGLTTTPEFGWKAVTDSPANGVTRNPWNPALTPGGSSGGAAVAATTGAGVLHLGTDGGGSIRIPSAFCGIVGLKPSFGRVPAYPASAFGTVAHLGPMARRSDDAFVMLCVMSGNDPRDWFQGAATLPPLSSEQIDLSRLRIGYWRTPPCGRLDHELGEITDNIVHGLERDGAKVDLVELPKMDLLSMFETLWFAGAANRASQLDAGQSAKLDTGLSEIVASAASLTATGYVRASAARVAFGLAMDRLLEDFDALVSPAVTVPPFPAGLEVPAGSGFSHWTEWAGFSFPINLSQQPAVVVPCGRTAAGLPTAIQFIGSRGADARVISIAKAFELARAEFFL